MISFETDTGEFSHQKEIVWKTGERKENNMLNRKNTILMLEKEKEDIKY